MCQYLMLFPAASFFDTFTNSLELHGRELNPCSILLQQGFASRQPPMSSKLQAPPAPSHQSHALLDPICSSFIQLLASCPYGLLALQCTRTALARTSTYHAMYSTLPIHTTLRFSVRGGKQLGPARTRLASSMPLISFASYSRRDAPFPVLLLRVECSLPLHEIDLYSKWMRHDVLRNTVQSHSGSRYACRHERS